MTKQVVAEAVKRLHRLVGEGGLLWRDQHAASEEMLAIALELHEKVWNQLPDEPDESLNKGKSVAYGE